MKNVADYKEIREKRILSGEQQKFNSDMKEATFKPNINPESTK